MNNREFDEYGISDLISNFQFESLKKIGVPSENIPEFLFNVFNERLSYDPAQDYEITQKYLNEIPVESLYVSLKKSLDETNLSFQCPYTHLLLSLWKQEFLEGLPPKERQEISVSSPGNIKNPVLASAYTGKLNAATLRASDGTRGIVFEDELLNLFQIAAIAIAGLILEVKDNKISLNTDPFNSNKDQERFQHSFRLLFGSIKTMLTNGSTMQPGIGYIMPVGTEFEILMANKIACGMFRFVYGHEWGHIVSQHYELLMGLTDRHIPRRKVSEQEEAIKKYIKKYSHIFPNLYPNQLEKFVSRQMIEIEADTFSYLMAASRCFHLEELDERQRMEELCSAVGTIAVLPLFNIIEILTLKIAYGGELYPTDLLGEDEIVQNLYFRTTHPSPQNRVNNMLRFFRQWSEDNEDLLGNGINVYLSLIEEIPTLINKAFIDWSAEEINFEEFGYGVNAIKPQWRGLLDEFPRPISADFNDRDASDGMILTQKITRDQIYDQIYYFKLGYLLIDDENHLEEAEKCLRRVVEINPSHTEAYQNLGYLLSKYENRSAEAEAIFRDGISHSKEGVNDFLDKIQTGEIDDDFVSRTIKVHQFIEITKNFGNLFLELGSRLPEAEQCFQENIVFLENYISALKNILPSIKQRIDEDDDLYAALAKTYVSFGNVFAQENDKGENYERARADRSKPLFNALEFIEENLKPDSYLYRQLAGAYLSLGFVFQQNDNISQISEENFQKAFDMAQNSADFHFELGNLLRDLGNNEQRIKKHLWRSIEIDNNFLQAYRNLGLLLSEEGVRSKDDWREFKMIYEKLIEIDPDFTTEIISNLKINMKMTPEHIKPRYLISLPFYAIFWNLKLLARKLINKLKKGKAQNTTDN